MSAADRLRTIPDAGRELGVSRWTVRRWVEQGKLATVTVNGRRRIRDTELDRFRREGER